MFTFTRSLRNFSRSSSSLSAHIRSVSISSSPPVQREDLLKEHEVDFNHWLIVMKKTEGHTSTADIINSFIRTLATVDGSEEEAVKKIYSVSFGHFNAFGALISEQSSNKIKALPSVRWVLPDFFVDKKINYMEEINLLMERSCPVLLPSGAEWESRH